MCAIQGNRVGKPCSDGVVAVRRTRRREKGKGTDIFDCRPGSYLMKPAAEEREQPKFMNPTPICCEVYEKDTKSRAEGFRTVHKHWLCSEPQYQTTPRTHCQE